MKKAGSIFMSLLLLFQLSACVQTFHWKYDFPEYNQFIEEMEEKYPKFKMKFSAVSDSSSRQISISGEIPPEDYYDIFIEFINLFLTGNGYTEFCKGTKKEYNPGVSGISITFYNKKSGKEEASFGCTPHPSYEKLGDASYQGFVNWGIILADGLSGSDNTTADIWYQDGVFIRKILGSYDEELFNYREYFGFEE